ncbi:MAG: transcriptional repressor LexA [Thermodesulfobacteriota bacterium]
MQILSPKQDKILLFITGFQAEYNFPPSVREICAHFGFTSPKAAIDHLKALGRKGYLQIHGGKSRGITLVKPHPAVMKGIPILGRIAAGLPVLAVENIEDTLPVERHFFGDEECFAIWVYGDSMIGAHIEDGDCVIVRVREKAQNGDIVAALIDDEVTLKYFYEKKDKTIELRPANPRYKPIIIKPDESKPFRILGVMAGLVRKI